MLQAAPSRALLLRKKRLRIRRLLLIVRILTGRPASLSLSVFNFDALRVAQLRTQGHTTVGGGLESKTQSDVWTADFPFFLSLCPFFALKSAELLLYRHHQLITYVTRLRSAGVPYERKNKEGTWGLHRVQQFGAKTQSDVWTADFFLFPFFPLPFLCTRNLLNFYYIDTTSSLHM